MDSALLTAPPRPAPDGAVPVYEVAMPLPEGGSVRASRRVVPLPDGLTWIEEEMEVEGRLGGAFVTGLGWIVEWHRVEAGAISYRQDGASIGIEAGAFALLFAPFSITEVVFENVHSRWVGVAGTGPLPGESESALFDVEPEAAPSSARALFEALSRSRGRRSIARSTRPSPHARRAKAMLDASYREAPSIASLAARLGVSHPHLTRQFTRAYGMSPVAYRHRLRASEAAARLAQGERIVDVSGDVGYEDLGRFYKAFRRVLNATPGGCRLP